jgi:hypothetical protein
VNDYRRALDIDDSFHRAKEGMQTAQKRQKQGRDSPICKNYSKLGFFTQFFTK